MSLCRATACAAISAWSRIGAGNDQNLAVGIVGIGAHGHGGPADGRQVQARRADLPALSAITIALPGGMAPM